MRLLTAVTRLFLVFCASSAAANDVPPLKKVMIVMFENMDQSKVMAQPFFAKLSQKGVLLSNFFAETHPSQGNYIALTSGALNGVHGDGDYNLDVRHIGDLLEERGLSWRVYAEDYPGNCFTGSKSGLYVRKHVPFMSYTNVTGDPSRCAMIVNADSLAADLNAGTLPNYAFYVPNLRNDGHDTDAAFADRWLEKTFTPLFADQRFTEDMLLIITFDESSLFGGNHIYTVMVGDALIGGSRYEAKTNHYGLLRTIEDGFGLGTLGAEDQAAAAINGIWH